MVMRLTSSATPWPLLAVALLCTAAGFTGGYALKSRLASAEIARIEAAHAAQQQAAAEEAARRLAAAQDAERAAVHALQATKNRLAAANRKLKEALYGLPTAAECGLSGPARGLLNRALDPAAAPMPTDTGGAAGTAAAPAADPGATEADIAGWAADAIALYGECRARIDAIRQWDEVTHGR